MACDGASLDVTLIDMPAVWASPSYQKMRLEVRGPKVSIASLNMEDGTGIIKVVAETVREPGRLLTSPKRTWLWKRAWTAPTSPRWNVVSGTLRLSFWPALRRP
jgi:hypothetical protein